MLNSTDKDSKLNKFSGFLTKNFYEHKQDFSLKFDTYFLKGGKVKLYVIPQKINDFVKIINELRKINQPFDIVALCTNVLFLDEIDYSVVITTRSLRAVEVKNSIVTVDAGYPMFDFVRLMLLQGSKGYAGLEGIPGTIGGAVFMNAGAYGYSISDQLDSVLVLDEEENIKWLNKDELGFEYRNSIFKKEKKYIILKVKFNIVPSNKKLISNEMEKYHIARHSYQEFTYPNLGSMYSVPGDIYKPFFIKKLPDKFKYYILKVVLKNPITKFFMRKKPSNLLLNNSALRVQPQLSYPLSHKSINILINTGDNSGINIIEHLGKMKSIYGTGAEVENEIMFDSIYKVEKDLLYKIIELKKGTSL